MTTYRGVELDSGAPCSKLNSSNGSTTDIVDWDAMLIPSFQSSSSSISVLVSSSGSVEARERLLEVL